MADRIEEAGIDKQKIVREISMEEPPEPLDAPRVTEGVAVPTPAPQVTLLGEILRHADEVALLIVFLVAIIWVTAGLILGNAIPVFVGGLFFVPAVIGAAQVMRKRRG